MQVIENQNEPQAVEQWLRPISETNPAGEDARYDEAYGALREDVASLDRPDADAVDWDGFTDKAGRLLAGRSKDILVACYFAHGSLRTRGIAGLVDGLACVSGVLDRFWESCFPPLKRMRGRVNAVSWFVERTANALADVQPAHGEALARESERFATLVSSKFGDEAPSVRPLLDAVARIQLAAAEQGGATEATAASSESAPGAAGATVSSNAPTKDGEASSDSSADVASTHSDATTESAVAAPQPVALDPKEAKLAALRQEFAHPISESAPAGQDPRYDELREVMQQETQKLNRAAGAEVDWELVRQNGRIILTQRAKDIGVASFFAVACYELGGVHGLSEGLCAINAFLESYWDNGFPSAKRIRGRANALGWFVERVDGLGELVPSTDQQESIEMLELAVQEFVRRVGERFEDQAPSLRRLTDNVQRVKLSLQATTAAATTPNQSTTETNQTSTTTGTSPAETTERSTTTGATQTQSVQLDAPTAELADPEQVRSFLQTVGASLHKASRELFKVSVANPLAYRLCRMGLYLHFEDVPPTQGGNQSAVPAPPADRAQQLNMLLSAQNWAMLLEEAESGLGPSRLWLDLHRYVAMALQGLGHEEARAAVVAETAALVRRLPKLAELTFNNGQPFATTETQQWLAAEAGAASSGPVVAGGGSSSDMDGDLQAAHQLAVGGKLEEALAKLTAVIESESVVGRDRFRAKLAMAQACSAAGSHALADGIFAGLNEEIERFRLELWEPSLAEACYCGRYKALKAMGTDDPKSKGELADVYRQLCRVAPSTALKLGKPS